MSRKVILSDRYDDIYTVSPLDFYIDATSFAVGGPYQVQLTYNFPDIYTVNTYEGAATIGPFLEFPNQHYGTFSVNLKLRKMTITFLGFGGWNPSATFNGPVFTLLTSGANLPQSAYFISSTINTSLMTLTSTPTTIALNWKDVGSYSSSDVIVIGW